MRVVIVDADLKAGRRLAASVEQMVPTADVLLYGEPQEALDGIEAHSPDVAFVGPAVNGLAGPAFLAQALEVSDAPKYVGIVDEPDADASVAWIDAGARLVVSRPIGTLDVRTALRHTSGGVDA